MSFQGISSPAEILTILSGSKDVLVISLIYFIVAQTLYDDRSLLFVYQTGRFRYELFRIFPELIKYCFLNATQNGGDCFSGKFGVFGQLAYEVICHH